MYLCKLGLQRLSDILHPHVDSVKDLGFGSTRDLLFGRQEIFAPLLEFVDTLFELGVGIVGSFELIMERSLTFALIRQPLHSN